MMPRDWLILSIGVAILLGVGYAFKSDAPQDDSDFLDLTPERKRLLNRASLKQDETLEFGFL